MILVDDLRSFVDGRKAELARTSAAGVELVERRRDQRLMAQVLRRWGYRVHIASGSAHVGYLGGTTTKR